MIPAVQVRDFGVSNSLFSNAAAHTKSCCQKIKDVIQKVWDAIKRAIDTLFKPCKHSWNKDTHKVENITPQNVVEEVQRGTGVQEPIGYRNYHNFFEEIQREALATPPDRLNKGLLFEILDNVGASKGYLFGAIHRLAREQHHWHSSIFEKFHDSTHLGFEIIGGQNEVQQNRQAVSEGMDEFFNDPELDPIVLAQTAEQMRLACVRLGNVTPQEILSHEQWLLRGLGAVDGLPENETNKWKNRFNLQFYKAKLSTRQQRPFIYEGADYRLGAAALIYNKPVVSMDNMDIFIQESKLDASKMYRKWLGKNVDEIIRLQSSEDQEMDQLYDAWKRGDYVEFCRLREVQDSDEMLRSAQDPILLGMIQRFSDFFRQRNIHMATTIDRFIREGRGKLFASVGCDHLPRPDGMIELLRQRGWTVQQVGAPQIQVPEVPLQAAAGE